MTKHERLSEAMGIKVYFADPHSLWQCGHNENTNGLLRQYRPKGTDLVVFYQVELDDIAWEMNTPARARVWAGSARLNCSCQNRSMFISVIMKSSPWAMSFGLNALLLHFDLETARRFSTIGWQY